MKEPKLYASLVGPLLGLLYPLPFEDKTEARIALGTSRLRSLWCSVYSRAEAKNYIDRYGCIMLPDKFARALDYDADFVKRELELIAKSKKP